jgi:hypothetical protein
MLTILIEHHILALPDTRSFAMLARTCKKAHELLKERMWSDKWKFFQPKFLLQLDFFDLLGKPTEMDYIVFSTRGTHLVATIHRNWDFVSEAMTVIARVESCRPDDAKWKGWEFAYVYDAAQTVETNLNRFHAQLRYAARVRQSEME